MASLQDGSIKADPDTEIIALIAYLQRLGHGHQSAPADTDAWHRPSNRRRPPEAQRAPATQTNRAYDSKRISSNRAASAAYGVDLDLPVLRRLHRRAVLGAAMNESVSEYDERPAAGGRATIATKGAMSHE